MNGILDHDVEELGSMLNINASVRTAFEAIVDIVEEISVFIEEQNRGLTSRFLRKRHYSILLATRNDRI